MSAAVATAPPPRSALREDHILPDDTEDYDSFPSPPTNHLHTNEHFSSANHNGTEDGSPAHHNGTHSGETKATNRRDNEKAYKVLGHDPSKEKAKARLGLDEAEMSIASTPPTTEEATGTKRRSEPMLDKKANKKALDLLGHDPSHNKIVDRLGLANQQEAKEAVEESKNAAAAGPPSTEPEQGHGSLRLTAELPVDIALADRKTNRKAMEMLGVNPSLAKVKATLGLSARVITTEEAFADRVVSIL